MGWQTVFRAPNGAPAAELGEKGGRSTTLLWNQLKLKYLLSRIAVTLVLDIIRTWGRPRRWCQPGDDVSLAKVLRMTQVAEAGVLFACQCVAFGKQCSLSSLAIIDRDPSLPDEELIEGRVPN